MPVVEREISVIPATFNPKTHQPKQSRARRKVAGYARVSTDSDEQLTSYEAQVDYYTNYIKGNPEWEFVGVYTDEGVSGLNTRRREGFNQMVEDALAGKISLIVTKSVSRFARNTVDSLTTIRELKAHGTEVYFEKESIWTFDSKGELLLTIMSSLAQEESRSISENVTWGQRKRMADGKVSMAYSRFLGYRKGADGLPEIVPEEAETVRRIYRLYIEGRTTAWIAKHLTKEGVPTPAGKTVWQERVVTSILTNEKYKGEALLQKEFTVDFLTKKMKKNEGEVPQYYVKNSHPAIISPVDWQKVQDEMQRRKNSLGQHNGLSPFSGKLFCGDCGGMYGSKVWHSNDQYRRVIWQCNNKFTAKKKCTTPHLTEDQIKTAFYKAVAILMADRDRIMGDILLLSQSLADTGGLDEKEQMISEEMSFVLGLIEKHIQKNTMVTQNQEEYQARYDELVSRYESLQKQLHAVEAERSGRVTKGRALDDYVQELSVTDTFSMAFSPKRWNAMVDRVDVYKDGRLVFHFAGDQEITVNIWD